MPASAKSRSIKGDKTETSSREEPLDGTFVFANGDKYVGQYILTLDSTIQRHGTGEHILADGTVYRGTWKNDILSGHGKVEFCSGSFYKGELQGTHFSGRGTFNWANGSTLTATFEKSKACGNIQYTDVDGRQWLGESDGKMAKNLRLRLA